MDRITRYAKPHCYDASRVPLSFLDNGQRSRSSPRINVDSITRKACPERLPSDSSSTTGIAGSRLRAQSTDSLTWRRAVALKTRQHVIASRQHQSHAELRTDSSECLFGTVVVDFSDSQIGEPAVFDSPKPLECSTPVKPLTNGASKPESVSSNCDIIRKRNCVPEEDEKDDGNESRVRPVVETVAVHGRRLSYSKAAGADRLDSSDLDELARQIGLIHDDSSDLSSKPSKVSSRSQTILNKSIESLKNTSNNNEMDVTEVAGDPVPTTTAATIEPQSQNKDSTDSRTRKHKMGWLGGLFRRLRHGHESSTPGGESKKHRRRARSLPPSSKGRNNSSQGTDQPPPSSGTESPVAKKSSIRGFTSAKSSFKKQEPMEKTLSGVSRSRTVDDIERARGYNDEVELVLPKLNATRISESEVALNSDEVEDHSSKNGHMEKAKTDTVDNKKSSNGDKSSQPPSYCNLAILAYGYSVAYPGLDIHESKKSSKVKEVHLVNASEVNETDDAVDKPTIQILDNSSSDRKESFVNKVEPTKENDQLETREKESVSDNVDETTKAADQPETRKIEPAGGEVEPRKEADQPETREKESVSDNVDETTKAADQPETRKIEPAGGEVEPRKEADQPETREKESVSDKVDETTKAADQPETRETEYVADLKESQTCVTESNLLNEEIKGDRSDNVVEYRPQQDKIDTPAFRQQEEVVCAEEDSKISAELDTQPSDVNGENSSEVISENTRDFKDNSLNDSKRESTGSGTTKSTARVTISNDVDIVELGDSKEIMRNEPESPKKQSSNKGPESPGIVVRRKKTVSCSEAPESLPRSSLIMLAVSQASPRPKTEMIDAAFMRNTRVNPMSVSQHEDIVPSGVEEKDGFYFLRLASEVEADFRAKMDIVERELVIDSEKMNDEVSGILRSLVGKANLLLTDKFSQLRGLCQQNISEQVDPTKQRSSLLEGFATRNSDLDGYWALVELQIDDVKAQFSRVDKLRKDGWQLPSTSNRPSPSKASTSRSGPVKRKKKIPSTTSETKSNRSAISQARLEAKKRLENAKREAASKMKSATAQNNSDGDVFIFV